MKNIYIVSIALLIGLTTKAQNTVLANFDFNGSASYPLAAASTASNITASVSGSQADAAYSGTVTGTNAFIANTTAGNSLSMTNTNVNTWTVTLGGSDLFRYASFKMYFQGQRSSDGATTVTVAYSTNGSTYTNASTTASPGNGSFTEATIDLSAITAINNPSTLYIKFTPSGATNSAGTLRIDNLQIEGAEGASETNGTSTTFNGAVTAPSLTVTGNTSVLGTVTSSSLNISSLANNGGGTVYIDDSGNLTVGKLCRTCFSYDIPLCNPGNPAWLLGGNTIGNIANPRIGTCDARDFIMETNSLERMRVDAYGYVSIGAGSAAAQLDILVGNTVPGLNINNSSGSIFNVGNDGTTKINSTSTTNAPFTIQNSSGNLFNVNANGKVGIGTTSPIQTLDVNGDINVANGIIQRGGSAITSMFDLGLYSQVANNFIRLVTNNGSVLVYSNLSDGTSYSGAPPIFSIANSGQVTINDGTQGNGKVLTSDANGHASWQTPASSPTGGWQNSGSDVNLPTGNVNIGNTTGGTYPLNVCGTIQSKEVIVSSTWCDYVFEDKYKRMPFEEQIKYYRENKHLKEVPTANDVETNGLPVSVVVRGLTLNMEETKLDMIDLYKMIQELQKQNQLLKKEIENLKK